MENVSATMIPISIAAPTRQKLTLAMLNNNLVNHKQYQYFDIQNDGKAWIAWFMEDIKNYKDPLNVAK